MEPNDGNDEDCKPRKLEETDEIVEYLLSLKDQLATLSPTSDAEDVDILVENVLLETKSRMASAASDRRTNLVIEKIVSLACFNHLRIVIEGFSPYALFLARNRYSSHIIQVSKKSISLHLPHNDDSSGDLFKTLPHPPITGSRWNA